MRGEEVWVAMQACPSTHVLLGVVSGTLRSIDALARHSLASATPEGVDAFVAALDVVRL